MNKVIIFREHQKFVPDKILVNKRNQEITYWDHHKKEFFLQTPTFKIVDFYRDRDHYYLIVNFNKAANLPFFKLLNSFDSMMCSQLKEISSSIYRSSIGHEQTLKFNPMNNEYTLMRLKVQIVHDKPTVTVYDDLSDKITFGMIGVGFTGKALLRPHIDLKNKSSYWEPIQLKIDIPEAHFDDCVLSDNDEDIDDYYSDQEYDQDYSRL